jgi:effector-binding domain-containing protein
MRFPLLMMFSLLSSILPACAKYESPDYTVERKDGSFEIRTYPSLTVVSTPMQHRGGDGSFMKLFRYISGRNEQAQKISMTTPVLMTGTESGTMSFVVPKEVARKGAPIPSNPEVTLHELPATRYAAYRFSGSSRPGSSEKAAAKLLDWVHGQHLHAEGSPLFAYYNPPWTPGFMRRNEVLIRLVPGDSPSPASH